MKTSLRLLIVATLAVAVAATFTLRKDKSPKKTENRASVTTAAVAVATNTSAVPSAKLPKLVDLGAGKCVPCKLMAPILEELKKEYAGRMNVEFIDVWQNPDAAKPYNIEVIPTQIFYDAEGKELFRHVGFFAKPEILGKWKELGLNLDGK
jgi:thioredoxin 1